MIGTAISIAPEHGAASLQFSVRRLTKTRSNGQVGTSALASNGTS